METIEIPAIEFPQCLDKIKLYSDGIDFKGFFRIGASSP